MSQNDARRLLEAWDFFEKNPSAKSWEGFSRDEFFALMALITGEESLLDAKAYLEKIERGEISETVPQKIVEAAKEGKISENDVKKVERAIASTKVWIARLEVKTAEDVAERQVRVAEIKALLKEEEEAVPAPPVIPSPEAPRLSVPVTIERGLRGRILTTRDQLLFLPFQAAAAIAGPTMTKEAPKTEAAVSGLARGWAWAGFEQNALASGASPSQVKKLQETMKSLPLPLGYKIMTGYATWADLSYASFLGGKLSPSEIQAFVPSTDGSTIVLGRPSFVGGIFSQIGTRLLGRTTTSILTRMIGGSGVVAAGEAVGAGAGAAAGAAAAGGAAAGAAAGTAVAPVVGTAIGAVVGWVSSKIPDIISWFKIHAKDFGLASFALLIAGLALGNYFLAGLGGGLGALSLAAGGTGAISQGATSFIQALFVGLTTLILPSLAVPLIIAFISVPILVAFIFLVINSGAFVSPASAPFSFLPPGGTIVPGICKTPDSGYCSLNDPVTKLQEIFRDQAQNAAQVCQKESGGSTIAVNDGCLQSPVYNRARHTADYSIGLFQINMLSHPNPAFLNTQGGASLKNILARHGGKLCYQAFSNYQEINAGNYGAYCQVEDQGLLDDCVAWFKDPANNVAYANFLYNSAGESWKDWSAARACSIVK